ncbi:hypothetical protein CH274_13445 [Rhodococcus sp. 06-418-5]|uniref:DNA cytosine methyltransferase n=1 Tax=Rhodococcus sp. 06-418-5 TaxID=2022507 RepID=UPI000B9B5B0C|nr:DNA cytosine methyltransferase [Rhodococcus sp. 06-418-5]OZC80234.1 hypothetical protein CH274_13445 [Rhodococcus sp. 06-418-5]
MKTGSLFSGYDGLGLAVDELFPGNTREWFCEWDDAPSKILSHHWPTVPNLRDVTEVDWAAMPPVDILTGGYPCQPFSTAGQRKGADDERHLWPYVREAIRHLRPRFTLLENVAGHRTLGFDRVLGDLAEDGMHVRWTSIRASDIGAPHHRERVFILVTNPGDAAGYREWTRPEPDEGTEGTTDAHGERRRQGTGQPCSSAQEESSDFSCIRSLPNPGFDGLEGHKEPDSEPEQSELEASLGDDAARCSVGVEWGNYAPAVRRWERLTRPAPSPTELNSNGRARLNAAFAEWMMGVPAGHVTSVPISRAHQLKAIGNGVCPPQAVAAYLSLLAQAVAA